MMSDAVTAANIITDAMAANQFAALVSNARARRDYEGEIAHLRAWLEWYERQRVALVALGEEAIRVGKAELAKSERKISALERENQELRLQNDALQRQNADLAANKRAAEEKAQEASWQLIHWRIYGCERPAGERPIDCP
jgi:regulator of replication initiation timing